MRIAPLVLVVLLGGCAASSPLWSECDVQSEGAWYNPDEVPGQGTCPDGYVCAQLGSAPRCLVRGNVCEWDAEYDGTWNGTGYGRWACVADAALCAAWHPGAAVGPGAGCAVPCTQHSDCEGGQRCLSYGWCGPR
jgi:hypothetical protein